MMVMMLMLMMMMMAKRMMSTIMKGMVTERWMMAMLKYIE